MAYGVDVNGVTYVYTPLTAQTNQVSVQVTPGYPAVFLGSFNQLSVPAAQGLPLYPGATRVLRFPASTQPTIYASAGYTPGASTQAATLGTGTGLATVGTTKLTVTTMSAAFAAGTVLQLGNSTNQEYVIVASTASTVVTLSNPTLLYHAVGDVMTVATSVISQLNVTTGVL